MTRGQKNRQQRKRRKRAPGLLVAHRVFAPMMGLWGAVLAGASVMVVPGPVFAGAIAGTMLADLGALAQPAIAGLAAVLLGTALFVIAAAASRKASRRGETLSVAEFAVRRVIDPARDLGGQSLDDPLDTMPVAKPAWQDVAETAAEPEFTAPPALEDESGPAPLSMDLAAFAELPGRNAVWVEENAAEAEAESEAEAEAEAEADADVSEPLPEIDQPVASVTVANLPLPEPGTAALARLRAVPTSELSLAEMVERFAGALHEHRTSPPARSLSAADLAAREAALAEALKALAALSGEDASSSVREPLRAAIAQLQTPRRSGVGAA
jgi:hypothetical protein